MKAPERPLGDQQIADLAALKATSELRQTLLDGSPEWLRARREEDGLIERVLAWVGQRSEPGVVPNTGAAGGGNPSRKARAEGPHPPRRVPRGKCLDEYGAPRSRPDDEFVTTQGRSVGCGRPHTPPCLSPSGDWWALGALYGGRVGERSLRA